MHVGQIISHLNKELARYNIRNPSLMDPGMMKHIIGSVLGVYVTEVKDQEMHLQEFEGILKKFNDLTGWGIKIDYFEFENKGFTEKEK